MQFKILPYLENFAGINSTFMCIIFVSSATHEKCEIKNTSKFSTRTVVCFIVKVHTHMELFVCCVYTTCVLYTVYKEHARHLHRVRVLGSYVTVHEIVRLWA